jgi:two-component system CheB/CheR fusion protein
VDLISCRNTLIYLAPALQNSVLPIFHYSLNPSGLLFLGSAESVSTTMDLFDTVDRRHKLFARKDSPSKLSLHSSAARNRFDSSPPARAIQLPESQDLHRKVDQLIQSRYAPDAVLINQNLQIVQLRGRAGIYLESGPASSSQHLLMRARESLQGALRRTISSAMARDASVREEGLSVPNQGKVREINLEVTPLPATPSSERYYLVVFEQAGPPPEADTFSVETSGQPETPEQENAKLHQELADFREYLHTIKEEYEAALEEQRATNEELSSANEELQSINEELATTKEELQSANEELNTLNEELQNRNHELGTTNDDLTNLLLAVDMPIVMVDGDLQLRRSNPAAARLLGLSPADAGRSITGIMDRAKLADIGPALQQVNDTLVVVRLELQDQTGCWWSLSLRPYRTGDNRIDGIVLSFADVDSLKRSLDHAEEARDYSEAIVETVRDPLLVLTPEMKVERANAAFYRTFQTSRELTDGILLYELDGGAWNIPQLREMLSGIIPDHAPVDDFLVEHEFPRIGRRSIMLNARAILQRDHTVQRILLGMQDVTERLALEKRLTRSNADLEAFGYMVAHDLQEPLRSISSYTELLGRRYQGQLDSTADEFIKYVQDGVARMAALIRDLLAYSRLATTEAVIEDVDMNAVLREVVDSLQAAIAESGASVKYDNLPAFRYSSRLIVQVLQNLVGNSIKYRSDEPPTIRIAAIRGKNEWVISVHDNGIGFKPEAAELIFGVFKRLGGREYEGTGIGLAICKRIIERYGGRIWAESTPGRGSVFHFTVPDDDRR